MLGPQSKVVVPGLDPGIHAFLAASEGVDGRIKSGHDDTEGSWKPALRPDR
jgi:hypothetical protein